MDNPKKMKLTKGKVYKKSKRIVFRRLPLALQVRDTKTSWILWFYNNNLTHPLINTDEYENRLNPLTEVNTTKELLAALRDSSIRYLDSFHVFPPGSSFCFFLYEIKPVWEDDGNYNGGRIVTWIKTRMSDAETVCTNLLFYWEVLLSNIIAGYFEDLTPHICGAKVHYTLSSANKISLWTNDDVTKNPILQEKIMVKLSYLFEHNPVNFVEIAVDSDFQPHQKRSGYVGYTE